MKTFRHFILLLLGLAVINGCESEDLPLSPEFNGYTDGDNSFNLNKSGIGHIATGSIEFAWNGGGKNGEMGNQPEEMRAFFEFNAHEASALRPPKGEITYSVMKDDIVLHREIKAEVFDVRIDIVTRKAWILAKVISDTKGCSGGPDSGHDSGCGGSDHTDGETGCGDESTDHDGGCSHDDTGSGGTDEGGCSDGGTDGGGCAEGGTDEGGCTDGDSGAGSDSGMGSGSPGGGDMGNPLSGKNCRTGQIIALKVHDLGTPGNIADGITWKWFAGDSDFISGIGDVQNWPHLCKKTILEGNIVIHD